MPDTFVDQVGQRRITDGDEAARVDPVRDIAEFLRLELRKLREDRVELGDAVHPMTGYGGEVSHSYKARTALIDKRHSGKPRVIPRELRPHFFEKAMIDLVDDLEVAG